MSKRPASEGASTNPSSGGPAPKRKLLTQFEPVKIGAIYSLEELDAKILQFQNRKLVERIEHRRRTEEELRQRIEHLEQRQATDDAVLCIVNKYWNQLDEDIRVLLQRFDAEGADENEKKNQCDAVTSFLEVLSEWDKQEIETKLSQRVEFSKRAVCKLLQAYDRLLQRNERLWDAIKEKVAKEETEEALEKEVKEELKEDIGDNKPSVKTEIKVKSEPLEGTLVNAADGKEEAALAVKNELQAAGDSTQLKSEVPLSTESVEKPLKLNDAVMSELNRLMGENKNLHTQATKLHQRHHEISLQNQSLIDRVSAAETEAAEQKNKLEELEYNLENANNLIEKLDRHLSEANVKLKNYQEGEIQVTGGGEGVSKNKHYEILAELEDQRELATNRMSELEKLQAEHQEKLKEIEKLKIDLSTLPESVIVETTEYKCLQSQFSVLYNESMQMKTQIEETRSLLLSSKNIQQQQIEQMERDEFECQKKMRADIIQMEDQLAQGRREYDMLRIEFEQTITANEQTGPITREMRNLISSLKNHNEQLKGEVARYKRKYKEALAEMKKMQASGVLLTGETSAAQLSALSDIPSQSQQSYSSSSGRGQKSPKSSGSARDDRRKEDGRSRMSSRPDEDDSDSDRDRSKSDADVIRELRADLKQSQDREREFKLLLDTYKTAPKDTRDKAQLLANERKARTEAEELRGQLRKLLEERKDKRKASNDEETLRKIKRYEDLIQELQQKLALQKQEEETLLNEMEVTGQAFEDMQEQNLRLLQQLREKDDANFKLMSERIKSNQVHKILREEKEIAAEQVSALQMQVETLGQVLQKLEEKEHIQQANISSLDKELNLRQQAMDLLKRKAVESAQTAADLKLHLDKYHAQLKEAQNAVTDKTVALQQQTFKYKRMQEDLVSMRKKLERVKKIEQASSADEVLLEEIREYKEQLTCTTCKVKRKDAVLTKCFHVFCLDCLKTRYETRQRKCPKCNAAFGANDYHRIYLDV